MKNGLLALRKAHKLSQADLANAVQVTRQTIIAVEAGKYDPSLALAYKLAAYFEQPVESIFPNPFATSSQAPQTQPEP